MDILAIIVTEVITEHGPKVLLSQQVTVGASFGGLELVGFPMRRAQAQSLPSLTDNVLRGKHLRLSLFVGRPRMQQVAPVFAPTLEAKRIFAVGDRLEVNRE